MSVQEFVHDTLTQIVRAVVSANIEIKDTGAEISPPIKTEWQAMAQAGREISHRGLPMREIEFDIAVTVSDGVEAEASGGVAVSVVKFSAGGGAKRSNQRESRVKFAIPMTFPILK